MECRPLFVGRQCIGERFDDGKVFVFFGNRHFDSDEFNRIFSHWSLKTAKQVHGNRYCGPLTKASPTEEADAQWTSTQGLALCVYTADCVPVLIQDSLSGRIAAIHAGWRGLSKNIVCEARVIFKETPPHALRAWIGPHIGENSFEIRQDALDLLRAATGFSELLVREKGKHSDQFYFDLRQLTHNQLKAIGIPHENIWSHPIDTFASHEHYSFRRDGPTGRLLSFIVLQ